METKKNKFEKFGKKNMLNKKLLANVKGGQVGSGWISTVSGDCVKGNRSCWKIILSDILPF